MRTLPWDREASLTTDANDVTPGVRCGNRQRQTTYQSTAVTTTTVYQSSGPSMKVSTLIGAYNQTLPADWCRAQENTVC